MGTVLVAQVAFTQNVTEDPRRATPPLEVAVDCTSSPEKVTITNNKARPIKLRYVGSRYARRAGEPYRVRKTLKPGKSVSYTFGTGRGKGKRLSGSFVFDNDESSEGAVVRTNKGRVKVLCHEGTNAAPKREPEAEERPLGDVEAVAIGEPIDSLALLAMLPVGPGVNRGYEREFFEHWVDADGDGCDTRQEVLIRDSLTSPIVGSGCSVDGGTWYSAADGDTLTNPASIDINHVVPLKEAWESGAYGWTPDRRQAYANDLDDDRSLQAVSAGANRQQGQADPASWLPVDREVACEFVRDWVAVKARWELAVDEMEFDAIRTTLETCEPSSSTAAPG